MFNLFRHLSDKDLQELIDDGLAIEYWDDETGQWMYQLTKLGEQLADEL